MFISIGMSIRFVMVTTLNYLLNTTADSYTDIITNIGIYYYAVVAESPLGNRSVSNCVNVTVDGNDWPTFKGDLAHDGVGINGIGSNYAVAWKNQILPTACFISSYSRGNGLHGV